SHHCDRKVRLTPLLMLNAWPPRWSFSSLVQIKAPPEYRAGIRTRARETHRYRIIRSLAAPKFCRCRRRPVATRPLSRHALRILLPTAVCVPEKPDRMASDAKPAPPDEFGRPVREAW